MSMHAWNSLKPLEAWGDGPCQTASCQPWITKRTLLLYQRNNSKVWSLELLNFRIYKLQLKQQQSKNIAWWRQTLNMWKQRQVTELTGITIPPPTTDHHILRKTFQLQNISISPSDVTTTLPKGNSQSWLQQNTLVHHIIKYQSALETSLWHC
jgi:hypothetical protein